MTTEFNKLLNECVQELTEALDNLNVKIDLDKSIIYKVKDYVRLKKLNIITKKEIQYLLVRFFVYLRSEKGLLYYTLIKDTNTVRELEKINHAEFIRRTKYLALINLYFNYDENLMLYIVDIDLKDQVFNKSFIEYNVHIKDISFNGEIDLEVSATISEHAIKSALFRVREDYQKVSEEGIKVMSEPKFDNFEYDSLFCNFYFDVKELSELKCTDKDKKEYLENKEEYTYLLEEDLRLI